MRTQEREATAIGPVTNSAEAYIERSIPYLVAIEVTGSSDIIFHRWNVEAVMDVCTSGGRGRKGSKKYDDIESYVFRDENGEIGIPGYYLTACIANAARFRQDPRSPRKSAHDLFRAGVLPMTVYASLGTKKWDYELRCRVNVQRNGITRCRPAFKAGWQARFELQVILPEYIPPDVLHATLTDAGRLCGLADYRPTYGRFQVTNFEPLKLQ